MFTMKYVMGNTGREGDAVELSEPSNYLKKIREILFV